MGPIIKSIADQNILPLMPYKRSNRKKGDFSNTSFIYDQEQDCYTCPNYEILTYVTTTRQGYKEYSLDQSICQSCPLKDRCLSPKAMKKTFRVSVFKSYFDFADEIRLSDYGKEKYALRKQTIERVFGDFKERHGGRYTHFRGIKKVSDHVSLGFACMNIKKMALRLSERVKDSCFICWIRRLFDGMMKKTQKKNPILNSINKMGVQNRVFSTV
jgi:hypothetical protein